jgi:hypothetical protein
LKQLQPEIDRVVAASRRPRLDRVPPGGDPAAAPSITGLDVGIVRTLMRVETRRRIAEGSHDGAAACISALLRMAKQARRRDSLLAFTVQCATARAAAREAASLDTDALSREARKELAGAVHSVLNEPPYSGPDPHEMTEQDFVGVQALLKDLLGRVEPPG